MCMNSVSVITVISATPPMRMMAWWNAMLAREYSCRCAAGSASWSRNSARSPAMSASLATAVASRAARLSIAAQTVTISTISDFVFRTT